MRGKRWLVLVLGAAAAVTVLLFVSRNRERPKPPPTPAVAAPPVGARPTPAPPPRAAVAGRVTDAAGKPIPGAVVQLVAGADSGGRALARTDAGGAYRLADLAPGRWSAGASAVGFLPTHVDDLDLAPGKVTPLDLRLEPGGRPVSGTVSDRTGGPIAGAVVEVTPLHGVLSARDRHSVAALTDKSGRYRVHVEEGRHQVAASHPDYVGDARAVDVGAAGAVVDFALLPGGVIEGTVREHGSGAAVGGAVVSYEREALAGLPFGAPLAVGERRGTVIAGADGRFRVAGLQPGAIRLTARAPGRASHSPTVVSLGVAAQVTDVDVYVGGAHAVRGRVVYDDGAATAGAAVVAEGPAGRARAVTDDSGRYAIEGLAPGTFTLTASAEDALPDLRPRTVDVRDQDVDGVDITLTRGAHVSGRVEPPEVAEVAQSVAPGLAPGRLLALASIASTLTGRDGHFDLGPLPLGKTRIGARVADGRRGETEVTIPAGGLRDVVIRLEERGGLGGRVVDESGAPALGAVVHVRRVGAGEAPGERSVAVTVNGLDVGAERAPVGPDGRYAVKGLDPATYEVTVYGDDGEPLTLAHGADAPRVTLAENQHRDDVDLVVEARDGVIKGVVLGPDGRPLADAWVTATTVHPLPAPRAPSPSGPPSPGAAGEHAVMRAYVVTDEGSGGGAGGFQVGAARALTSDDGRFEITGLRRGKYRLVGEGLAGAARGILEGVETGSEATLRLVALRKLEGKVTFGDQPVAEFTVELDGPTTRRQTFRDPGGAFTMFRVDPGTYKVSVTAPEGAGHAQVTVPVDPAAPPAAVAVVLSANGRVVGRVVNADGSPMAGAMVLAAPDLGNGRLMLSVEGEPPQTQPDGSFTLTVPPGKHVLVVIDGAAPGGGRPAVRKPFAVAPGQVVDLGQLKAAAPPAP